MDFRLNWALSLVFLVFVCGSARAEPRLEISLPLERSAYQTNEWVDVAVAISAAEAVPPSTLGLSLSGEDGSRMTFRFPVGAIPPEGAEARRTEHFRLDGQLLRPGRYVLEAFLDARGPSGPPAAGKAESPKVASGRAQIEICSHVRETTFKLIDWSSRASGPQQAFLGEKGLGFNLLYAAYGGLSPDDAIRAGLDYMWCCTMGGGHQMDLRVECDWSDPYVLGGAAARAARQAHRDRTRGNALGVHFYDEPGLTWWKHSKTGEFTPHNLPSQDRAFKAAFGREPLQYPEVNAADPAQAAEWNGFLPYRPDPSRFPGRGRGYLSWQRDAVGYGQESVALIAHDAAGMSEAVGSSYEMMAGLDPLTPLALAGESSVIPASKRLESCPEARVAWEAWLPDRAARIAPLPGGRTAILSRDGSLRVLGGDGAEVWQAAFEGGEAWDCDASPSGDVVVVGASRRVLAWNGAGRRLWDAAVRDESPAVTVTFVAASPDSGSVAFGGSDGSLSLVLRDGKRAWTSPGDAPGQDPQPWAAGTFDASGEVLVALSSKELRASRAADGSVLCRVPGWTARVEPRLFGGGILVSNGEEKVGIFSPEKLLILAEVHLPHGGVTAAVPFPGGMLVTTESDGAVRALRLPSETGGERLLWEHKLERKIPKKVAPGARRMAVAWWGGTLEVLDETGTRGYLQKFSQDISDLAWAGDRWVVGLADGRVVALDAR